MSGLDFVFFVKFHFMKLSYSTDLRINRKCNAPCSLHFKTALLILAVSDLECFPLSFLFSALYIEMLSCNAVVVTGSCGYQNF